MITKNTTIARKAPEWLTRSVIYQVYLRAFTPEATIKAATQKLPELAELGVDIIYVCPFFVQDDDMRREFWSERQRLYDNPKNPYRISDYYNIDSEYGCDDDLREFVEKSHELGMKVIFDLVFLHCGPCAVFIDEHPDFVQRDENGEIALGQWHFPVLNFESPELREYLFQNMEYWMKEFDVDGYRCDVSDAVPLDFWEAARPRIEALNPEVITLAEGKIPEYNVTAFDMGYNFAWAGTIAGVIGKGESAAELRSLWEKQDKEYPIGNRFIRNIDNHDIAHDCCHGTSDQPGRYDERWGNEAVDAALVLSYVMDGVPFLYNGQEVADTAHHSIYDQVPIKWENGETPAGKRRRQLCRKLAELRHQERVLAKGNVEWLDNDTPDDLVSFTRNIDGERVVVIINMRDHQVTCPAPLQSLGSFEALLADRAELTDESLTMEPYGYYIAKQDS